MKKILKYIIITSILGVLSWVALGIYRENKIKNENRNLYNSKKVIQNARQDANDEKNDTQIENNNEQRNEDNQEKNNDEKKSRNLNLVAKEYKGYKVIANLKIKKLNIDTCVLANFSNETMETCVTKFYGPNPNEVGNFCISGHNYITKNMFGYLYKLQLGDTFILTDNNHGVVEYKIYDKYTVEASETYRLIAKNKWEKRSNLNYLLRLL